jgi:hypothetical protein
MSSSFTSAWILYLYSFDYFISFVFISDRQIRSQRIKYLIFTVFSFTELQLFASHIQDEDDGEDEEARLAAMAMYPQLVCLCFTCAHYKGPYLSEKSQTNLFLLKNYTVHCLIRVQMSVNIKFTPR